MAGYYGLSRALVARELRYLSTVIIDSGDDVNGRPWVVVYGPVSDMTYLTDEVNDRRGWRFTPVPLLETFHGECFTVITPPEPLEYDVVKLAEASDKYLD